MPGTVSQAVAKSRSGDGVDVVSASTPLQQRLLQRTLNHIRDDAQVGARVNVSQLARELNVSRSPLLVVLQRLEADGFLKRDHNRGFVVLALPSGPNTDTRAIEGVEDTLIQIAQDYTADRLSTEVSESEIMRRYHISRSETVYLLARLAEFGIIERKPGYGWRFLDSIRDAAARAESYRFRILIETAVYYEPGFSVPSAWIREMRHRHETMMASDWPDAPNLDYFEMNADFHQGLADASGNRYLSRAVQWQNQVRLLTNLYWRHGYDRMIQNCREHLQILAHVEAGDVELAAIAMRRHLESASRFSPPFTEIRGGS